VCQCSSRDSEYKLFWIGRRANGLKLSLLAMVESVPCSLWRHRRRATADNESTFWGGEPHDYANPDASSHLDEVRKLIFVGKVDVAEKLSAQAMGKPKLLMSYQLSCDVRLRFPGHEQATGYHRELRWDQRLQR
jgi:glycosyl hydrolase family 65